MVEEKMQELTNFLNSYGFEGSLSNIHDKMTLQKQVVVGEMVINNQRVAQKQQISISIEYLGEGSIDERPMIGLGLSMGESGGEDLWMETSTIIDDLKIYLKKIYEM